MEWSNFEDSYGLKDPILLMKSSSFKTSRFQGKIFLISEILVLFMEGIDWINLVSVLPR